MKKTFEVRFRQAEKSDLKRLTELSLQLGYENSIERLEERFNELSDSRDHVLLIAESKLSPRIIVGTAYFKKHQSLFVESSLEVAGLVVDKDYRSQGIGRLLMAQAEEIANEWKVTSVRLTSNIKRIEAHHFYRKLGYDQLKTSHFFLKSIKAEQ
jgi:GNAT superfamily N-acetyltransferase